MDLEPAQRVSRYLKRQITWFRDSIEAAESIDPSHPESLTTWGETLPSRLFELETLTKEHDMLLREWQNSEATDIERKAVRALADEAEELRATLETLYVDLETLVGASMTDTGKTLATLKRGQGLIHGYRPGGSEPGYLDRKA